MRPVSRDGIVIVSLGTEVSTLLFIASKALSQFSTLQRALDGMSRGGFLPPVRPRGAMWGYCGRGDKKIDKTNGRKGEVSRNNHRGEKAYRIAKGVSGGH